MEEHTDTSAGTSDERLMAAALHLIGEHGYHGATTRAIAAEAEVSEVTLFRRFGSKLDLTVAALTEATDRFRSAAVAPSDDLAADLAALASSYQSFVLGRPALAARLLAETTVGSEIGSVVADLIAANAEAVATVIVHHQQAGRLITAPVDQQVAAFLGPIMIHATVGRLLEPGAPLSPTSLDVADHVEHFLVGYGTGGE